MGSRLWTWLLFVPVIGLWWASLSQPALKAPAGGSFQYSGLNCLLLGWIGAFGKPLWVLPWSANVLYWMSLVSSVFRRQSGRNVLIWSLAAIPLALLAIANRTIEMNEGGDKTAVVPGLGFYLWLGSMVSLAAAVLVRRTF